MFADGYAISFEAFVGFVITVLGLWFVVQQLREAKLASQMEGLLMISDRSTSFLTKQWPTLRKLVEKDDWAEISDEEAYSLVFDHKGRYEAFRTMGGINELLGTLVKRKALDKAIVHDYFGNASSVQWNYFENVIRHRRKMVGFEEVAVNWEWLAQQFEKYSE
jgi:hypothetical protein